MQTTLSAIDEKRALRGELPLEVRDLEDEIAGLIPVHFLSLLTLIRYNYLNYNIKRGISKSRKHESKELEMRFILPCISI